MQSPFLIADRHPKVTLARPQGQPLADYDDGRSMARAAPDALREPVLLLDGKLRVVAASGTMAARKGLTKFALDHMPKAQKFLANPSGIHKRLLDRSFLCSRVHPASKPSCDRPRLCENSTQPDRRRISF